MKSKAIVVVYEHIKISNETPAYCSLAPSGLYIITEVIKQEEYFTTHCTYYLKKQNCPVQYKKQ